MQMVLRTQQELPNKPRRPTGNWTRSLTQAPHRWQVLGDCVRSWSRPLPGHTDTKDYTASQGEDFAMPCAL